MPELRPFEPADEEAVVDLSLRAWAPVFASVRAVLGNDLDALLHGEDWRLHQAAAVRATLADPAGSTWVALESGVVVGFVVVTIADHERRIGEIAMIAVDPLAQRRGIGRRLTELATDELRDRGMAVAVIGTGGDPGHAPARRLYEEAGYRQFPAAQYYRIL
jgi:ribosomal protein S18 acetylase RimI-like enzyme